MTSALMHLTAQIVSSHCANQEIDAADLGALINSVHGSLNAAYNASPTLPIIAQPISMEEIAEEAAE